MRRGLGRTAGLLAVVLSALWALGAAIFTGVGVVLVISGRSDDASVDGAGFLEFVGAGVIAVGALTLGAAALGIVLGRRTARGEGRTSLGLAALFVVFAAVSACSWRLPSPTRRASTRAGSCSSASTPRHVSRSWSSA